MNNQIETAILQELRHTYPRGFQVGGWQLAETLQVSPTVILDTATEMGKLPPKYEDGLLVVTTEREQFTGNLTGFYVSLQPWDADVPV